MYPVFIRVGFERLEVAKHPILKESNRMNIHKHARLTYARRLEMVQQMIELGWSAADAAADGLAGFGGLHGLYADSVERVQVAERRRAEWRQ